VSVRLENLPCLQQQVFQNRSQAQRREEGERAQNEITPTSSTVNSAVFTGKVPGEGGTLFFWPGCRPAPAPESS
jgi:hypothetical protein